MNLLKSLGMAIDDVEKQSKRPAAKGKANTGDAKKQTRSRVGKKLTKKRGKRNNRHRH